jgi:ribosomal protein S6--L-glutamate ligase
VIGIGKNEWAQGVPHALAEYCQINGIPCQILDFMNIEEVDTSEITHLAPSLLYFKPKAKEIYKELEKSGVTSLNPVQSIEIADDKAETYRVLKEAKVPQVDTEIIELSESTMRKYFEERKSDVIFKRRYGGQGRWVRVARKPSDISEIYQYFLEEGAGPILAQPMITEAQGKSVRVIVIDNEVVISALRTSLNDWRSNISLGSEQVNYSLSREEAAMSISAIKAIGLGHAGVDLIQTKNGSRVLEVNACPDFTSMKEVSAVNIAEKVIAATLRTRDL